MLASDELKVRDLVSVYLELGPTTKPAKREISWSNDASNLTRHLLPLIGDVPIVNVTRLCAARVLEEIKSGKTALTEKTGWRGLARVRGGESVSRRTRGVAVALWNWGIEFGYVLSGNPFANICLGMATERERFLTEVEAIRFLASISALQGQGTISNVFADVMRLLLLTGARRGEILGLRWEEVSLERRRLNLPRDRTKAGGRSGARKIFLSPEALEVLRRRSCAPSCSSSEFVFPASRGTGPATGLRKPFLRVCAHARLQGLRIHDLRHSFASFALEGGASLALISKALGHADLRSTERYAHASGTALLAVADTVASRIRASR